MKLKNLSNASLIILTPILGSRCKLIVIFRFCFLFTRMLLNFQFIFKYCENKNGSCIVVFFSFILRYLIIINIYLIPTKSEFNSHHERICRGKTVVNNYMWVVTIHPLFGLVLDFKSFIIN